MNPSISLAEQAIEAFVGSWSLAKGRAYYEDGAVLRLSVDGNLISARCQGSAASPYRIKAVVMDGTVEEANCSCPVGDDGRCKHVAAVLLALTQGAADMQGVSEDPAYLERELSRLSPKELVGIIQRMIEREPRLASLLPGPKPEPGEGKALVPMQHFKRRAEAVFEAADFGSRRASWQVSEGLSDLLRTGSSYLETGDPENASGLFCAVLCSILERYTEIYDAESEIILTAQESIRRLGSCLARIPLEGDERIEILKALFDACVFDLEYGGVGLYDEVTIEFMDNATQEERDRFSELLQDRFQDFDDFAKQTACRIILQLRHSNLSDEEYMGLCRSSGCIYELIEKLLDLGDIEQAVAETKQLEDRGLSRVADLFLQKGKGEEAARFMEARAQENEDTGILEWLRSYYQAKGDQKNSFRAAEILYSKYTTLDRYKTLQEAASTETWSVKKETYIDLARRNRFWDPYIEILLFEKLVEKAIAELNNSQGKSLGIEKIARVAQDASESFPDEAVRLFHQCAEHQIAMKNRGSYAEACGYLKKIRDIRKANNQEAAWDSFREELKAKYRQLRALHDEMRIAGLYCKEAVLLDPHQPVQ